MNYIEVKITDIDDIEEMSELASKIVKEYYDPILGEKQNNYMIKKFQSVQGITEQLKEGHNYYFVRNMDGLDVGFISFYPRNKDLYLSKFYLHKDHRGKGISKDMHKFVIKKAKELGLASIILNVNKYNELAIAAYERLGFIKVDDEKNDIGNGYYMDDFVYKYSID